MLHDIHCASVLCMSVFPSYYHAVVISTESILQQTIQVLLKVFLQWKSDHILKCNLKTQLSESDNVLCK